MSERSIKTSMGITCTFDECSLIKFWDANDEHMLSLDPTDLSVIYGAYQQMVKEINDLSKE